MPPAPPSAFDRLLGRFAKLEARRFGSAGAFLAEPFADQNAATLLLLGHEIPEGAREGDQLDVFVYRDSEGRPLATTQVPKLALGEVAFLRVTAVTEFGAFVDWGLPKELLVPFSQQTLPLDVGSRHPIGLYVDDSGRLAGTMRISEMLDQHNQHFEQDEWVNGEAWRNDPEIGLFAILERTSVGLVPREEPHGLARGQAARFRITNILPDGKLELSLRGHAHEQLDDDADHVLAMLRQPNPPRLGDRSSPEDIRDVFGLSKKAYKRAVGRLLKDKLVELDTKGHVRALPSQMK
jgi:predicted RNA-binding protein (virulence factor B family)